MNSDITKRLLRETMLTLSKNKPLKKIRISDITDSVGLCKRVFFYHFKNRQEFLYSTLEYIFSDKRLYDGHMPIQKVFRLISKYAYDHRYYLGQCIADDELSEKLYEILEKILLASVKNDLEQEDGSENISEAVRGWTCLFIADFLTAHILLRVQRGNNTRCHSEYTRDIRLMKDFFTYIEAKNISPLRVAFITPTFEEVSDVEYRLMNTMKQIAGEKPFKQILISEIIASAGISRTTFYKKNYSKYDLRNRIWTYDILVILNHVVDDAGNINYRQFRRSIAEYYAENINLYEGGILYNEYDSLYYALKETYDKNIRHIVSAMSLDYEYSSYAVNCIEYALIDCLLSPITKQGFLENLTDSLREEPLYNLKDALKYEMPKIWDKLIQDI